MGMGWRIGVVLVHGIEGHVALRHGEGVGVVGADYLAIQLPSRKIESRGGISLHGEFIARPDQPVLGVLGTQAPGEGSAILWVGAQIEAVPRVGVAVLARTRRALGVVLGLARQGNVA